MTDLPTPPAGEPIAVVGLACRFPGGADDRHAFWRLLTEGRDAVGPIPPERWSGRRFFHPDPRRLGKAPVREGGFLRQDVTAFDADFFGISPREAECLDPQQRLLLEVAWEALEHAGWPAESLAGRAVGTFVGAFMNDHQALAFAPANRRLAQPFTATGTTLGMLANRLAHVFDLRGPSLTLDTACSSSLVALHAAVESLRRGECTAALVGGVNLMLKPEPTVVLAKGRYLSPGGRCRAFAADADGYVRSEGAAVVALRPLADALAAGDAVQAVILATGVNQDGRTPGLSHPNREAQRALMERVARQAGIDPGELTYVEAHGTGTPAGDAAEAFSLGEAYGRRAGRTRPLIVGAVKTQLGHLEAAAGMAGLIKTVLVLQRRLVPANLHADRPNPDIPFTALGLRPAARTEPWPQGAPALAAVNAFGYGGTNAHAVLAGPPAGSAAARRRHRFGHHLLPLSARSDEALRQLAGRTAAALAAPAAGGGADLRSLCFTACRRRSHLERRLVVVGRSRADLARQLRRFAAGEAPDTAITGRPAAGGGGVAFVYGGMGAQSWAMGRELYRRFPAFRRAAEECDAALGDLSGFSLLSRLHGRGDDAPLAAPQLAQPANLLLQVALTALWKEFGVEPRAVVGHSAGEIAAACCAGVLTLEQAAALVHHRGRLLAPLAGGSTLLAAALPPEEAAAYARRHPISIAAFNGSRSVTLAGRREALEAVAELLRQAGTFHRFLAVDVAYHSDQLEPLRGALLDLLPRLRPGPATAAFYSTVEGGRCADTTGLGAEHWWRNLRRPVRFAQALDAMIEDGCRVFLEIGPHPVLAPAIRDRLLLRRVEGHAVASRRRGRPEERFFLESLGRLHALGAAVDWRRLYPGGRLAELPAYPWQRERHWSEDDASRNDRLGADDHPLLGRRQPVSAIVYRQQVSTQLRPYLADHRLLGRAVVPAAATAAAALALRRLAGGEGPATLRELRFERPLALAEDEEALVETSLDEATGEVTVRRLGEDGAAVRHASLWIAARPTPAEPAAPPFPARAQGQRPESFDPGSFYRRLAQAGLEYGPAFRRLKTLRRRGDEVDFTLSAAAGEAGEEPEAALVTALDACLQAAFAALGEPPPDLGGLLVPASIRRLRFWPASGPVTAGRLRIARRGDERLVADVRGYGAGGRLAVELDEVGYRPLAGRADRPAAAPLQEFHRHVWVKADPALPPAAGGGRRLLLLASRGSRRQAVARRLRAAGCDVTCRPGDAGDAPAARREALGRALASAGRLDTLVCLWPLEPGRQAPPARAHRLCTAFVSLVQACLDRSLPAAGGRLVLVTRGGVATTPDEPVDPAQASLWGLARVVRSEHPEIDLRLVDLPAAVDGPVLDRLAALLAATGGEEESALRRDGVMAHRMTSAPFTEPAAARPREDSRRPGGPAGPDPDPAAWLPWLAAAHHAVAGVAKVRLGQSVLLSVDGPLGLACALVASWRGARVFAVAGDEESAAQLAGAGVEAVTGDELAAMRLATARGARSGLDAAVVADCPATLRSAATALRPGGSAVLLGGPGGGGAIARALPHAVVARLDPARLDPRCRRRSLAAVRRLAARHGPVPFAAPPPAPAGLALAEAPAETKSEGLQPRADATYLVVGGTRGLGFETVKWLAARGARHFALAGRRGRAGAAVRAEIGKLRRRGIRVEILALDVTSAADVRAALQRLSASMPPIRGVFHSALVLDDGPVARLEPEGIARVMAPKTLGAWNLHRATRHLDLDLFVAYGSVASWLGSPGQASYAAANAFLEGLAQLRRHRGEPATVVHWGPIAEVGTVARDRRIARHLERLGFSALSPQRALGTLGRVITRQLGCAGVFDLDWRRWAEATSGAPTAMRLEWLLPASRQEESRRREAAAADQRTRLAALAPDARQRQVTSLLCEFLADRLGRPARRIDLQRPLLDLGVDSLTATEVQALIERTFGVRIHLLDMLGRWALSQLAERIVTLVVALHRRGRP